jgi:hypothetical protein
MPAAFGTIALLNGVRSYGKRDTGQQVFPWSAGWSRHHQVVTSLRGPLLVGFFLLALVIHGRIEQWWIEPVLSSLSEWPLMIAAMLLTALNDNAAITYLASLVPGFSDSLKMQSLLEPWREAT